MPDFTLHFLNVKEGDCTLIEHGSGRKTVVDVCNASQTTVAANQAFESHYNRKPATTVPGDFQQKNTRSILLNACTSTAFTASGGSFLAIRTWITWMA
ncbi:MAG: hypothetical protein R3E01_36470 [Pirellulaceae bacterium]